MANINVTEPVIPLESQGDERLGLIVGLASGPSDADVLQTELASVKSVVLTTEGATVAQAAGVISGSDVTIQLLDADGTAYTGVADVTYVIVGVID